MVKVISHYEQGYNLIESLLYPVVSHQVCNFFSVLATILVKLISFELGHSECICTESQYLTAPFLKFMFKADML